MRVLITINGTNSLVSDGGESAGYVRRVHTPHQGPDRGNQLDGIVLDAAVYAAGAAEGAVVGCRGEIYCRSKSQCFLYWIIMCCCISWRKQQGHFSDLVDWGLVLLRVGIEHSIPTRWCPQSATLPPEFVQGPPIWEGLTLSIG